jgi:hypothetical protein
MPAKKIVLVASVLFFVVTSFAVQKKYQTRSLAGKKLGDLFAVYTGISGEVPEEVYINFSRNLDAMWARKRKVARENLSVKLVGSELAREYRNKNAYNMTIGDYERHLNAVVVAMRKDINWEKVAVIEGLDRREVNLVRKIVGSLNGRDLVAYSLTELMPGSDGDLNVAVFDFLLRNGGRRYVESIPAMFDRKVSFGPYQFTEYAWYENKGERRGGSRLNSALVHPLPHGSVGRIRSDEHHIVALLLLVDNLSWIINRLDGKEFGVLERIWQSRHDDIVELVATAHHCPHGKHGAMGTARRWLDHGAKKSYWVSCNRKLSRYARNTAANLAALKQ